MPKTPLRMKVRKKGEAFPSMGTIRKGAKKPTGAIDGRTGKPVSLGIGKDLTHFRFADWDEKNPQIREFLDSFGNEPNDLPILMPYRSMERIIQVYNEGYRGGLMIHRCTPDDSAIILSALDQKTFRRTVADGRNIETGEVMHCDGKPLYYDGKGKPVHCAPVVRMHVMLRGQGVLATWDVLSGSKYDAEMLTLQMETFESTLMMLPQFAKSGFFGVPFILHRSPKEIPYYDESGNRKTVTKSLLWLELDPDYAIKFVDASARLQLQALSTPMLSAPSEDDNDDDPFLALAAGAEEEPPKELRAPAQTQRRIAAPVQAPPVISQDDDPFSPDLDSTPVEVSVDSAGDEKTEKEYPWPMSGQEFYDWSMKQGAWINRPGEKYPPKDVNQVFGMAAQAWVTQNPAQSWAGAAKTVSSTFAKA